TSMPTRPAPWCWTCADATSPAIRRRCSPAPRPRRTTPPSSPKPSPRHRSRPCASTSAAWRSTCPPTPSRPWNCSWPDAPSVRSPASCPVPGHRGIPVAEPSGGASRLAPRVPRLALWLRVSTSAGRGLRCLLAVVPAGCGLRVSTSAGSGLRCLLAVGIGGRGIGDSSSLNTSTGWTFLSTYLGCSYASSMFYYASPMFSPLSPGALGLSLDHPTSIDLAARHGFGGVDPDLGHLRSLGVQGAAEHGDAVRERGLQWGMAGLPVPLDAPAAEFRQAL